MTLPTSRGRRSARAGYGWGYFALFPLDGLAPMNDERALYELRKRQELVPIFGWLVPLAVLASGLGHLQGPPLLALFAFAAIALAGVARVHLGLRWNQAIEIALNLWLSMVIMMLLASLAAYGLGTASGSATSH